MAKLTIANQSAPATPSSGYSGIWVDSTTKKVAQTDDAGARHGALSKNFSTANLAVSAADTYITNSGILIPSFGMEAGQLYRWTIGLSKTAAGTAANILTFRIGTNQTTADTSRLALTSTVVQTAAIAEGRLIAHLLVRNVGASGVLAGAFGFDGNGPGFGGGKDGVSSSFDNSALAGNYVGLSYNNGTAGAHTITSVYAELVS